MTASLLLTLLSASPTPVLHARGPCATPLRGSLERVRPGTSVVIGGSVVEQDLEVLVDHEGSGWRLTVSGTDGSQRLERTLGDAQIPCEVVSDVAAEMVERYLVSIEWHGEEPGAGPPPTPDVPRETPVYTPPVLPQGLPIEAPAEPTPPPPDAGPPVEAAPVDAGASPLPAVPWVSRPEANLGVGITMGLSKALPAATLEVSVRVRRAVRASLWLGVSAPQTDQIAFNASDVRGQIQLAFAFAYGTVSACKAWGRLEACGGGAAGLAGAYGSVTSTGRLYQQSNGVLTPPAVAAVGRLAYVFKAGPEVGLQALAGVPLSRPAFTVEDYPTPLQFAVPPAELLGALHLGWSF